MNARCRTLGILLWAIGWALPLEAWDAWSTFCALPPFADVTNGEANPCNAAQDEIMLGCGGGNFCPKNPVTRAQAAMFFERAMRGTDGWSGWQGWSGYGSDNFQITVVVNPIPGDPAASGELLRQFLEGMPASATEPYVVKLEPGTYDLGTSYLYVQPWIHIEGSGTGVTRVVGTPASIGQPILVLAPHTEVRLLTVGPAANGRPAIGTSSLAGPRRLRDVNLEATTTVVSCGGALGISLTLSRVSVTAVGGAFQAAVASTECDLLIEDSAVRASGAGNNVALQIYGKATVRRSLLEARDGAQNRGVQTSPGSAGPLILEDSRVTASGSGVSALHLSEGDAVVRRSTLEVADAQDWMLVTSSGSSQGIDVIGSRLVGGEIHVGSASSVALARSQLDGSVIGSLQGTLSCYAVFDGNFQNANGIAACP